MLRIIFGFLLERPRAPYPASLSPAPPSVDKGYFLLILTRLESLSKRGAALSRSPSSLLCVDFSICTSGLYVHLIQVHI